MAQAAQIQAEPAPEVGPRTSALQRLLAPVLAEEVASAVVPLFPEAEAAAMSDADAPAGTDWPAAIRMIRDVAARVRQARAEAEAAGRRADEVAARSARQMQETEARLAAAEAETRAALLRAEQAEAAARAAEARAARAEEAMRVAQAGREEAQTWLKHLYACVLTEFEGLTETPPAEQP